MRKGGQTSVIQAIRERNPHRFVRKAWPWVVVVTVAFWLTLGNRQASDEAQNAAVEARATAAQVRTLVARQRQLINEFHEAVIQSCEENGNARAKVQREEINEEINENEHPDPQTFQALVEAGVRPEAIYEAEEKAIVKLKKRLDRIKVVDCRSQYHIGGDE